MTSFRWATASKALSSLLLFQTLLLTVAQAFVMNQCTVALGGLLADAALNQCIPFSSLSLLLTDPITPALINSTTHDFCRYPDCQPQSIALVQNTIVQNCLDGVNVPNDTSTAEIVYGIASMYPPLKQGMCSRIPNNGTFCLTEVAQSLGDYIRANPSPLGLRIFFNQTTLADYVAKVPKEILCTDCNKAMITPINAFVEKNMLSLRPEIVSFAQAAQKATAAKCGAQFLDGQVPNLNNQSGNGGKNGTQSDGGKSAAAGSFSALVGGRAQGWDLLLLATLALLVL
ncbi:hypothetical protein DFQ26_008082 [Actinomortierella ambigua]|nr:hypothetical protein DFQ26_008082 [Actinomortierella ambigua]